MANLDDIQLQDVGNTLGDDTNPFPLPILQPSQEQPAPWKLSVGAIASFPVRLRNPPPRLPQLKRFTVVPEFNVPLSDILQDKHPSPLSLREFEEYLLYVERSVENLYFCLWLRQYTRECEEHTADLDSVPPNTALARSFQRARQLFFDPASQYELNVTDEMIDPVRHLVRPAPHARRKEAWENDSGDEARPDAWAVSKELFATMYPRPRDLDKIKCEIEGLLRQSLTRFLQLAFTNSGRSHDKLAYAVWGVYLAGSIAVSIVLILGNRSRALRLVVAPMQIVAWTVLFASLNGICTAIYAFGDARQLYPHELFIIRCRMRFDEPYARPVDYKKLGEDVSDANSAEPILRPHPEHRFPNTHTPVLDKIRTILPKRVKPIDVERAQYSFRREDPFRSEDPVPQTPGPAFPAAAYIPSSPPCVQRQREQMHREVPAPCTAALDGFDISALSPRAPPALSEFDDDQPLTRSMQLELGDPRALGLYGPMVSIQSTLVRRVQRDIFVRSMWMAIAVTVPIMIILLIVPVRS